MFVGNLIALLMVWVMAVIILIVYFLLGLNNDQTLALLGLTLFLIDMLFRFFRRQNNKWFYKSTAGGHIYFLPVWLFGLIFLATGIVRLTSEK